jgi:hypothetical protein
LFGVIVWGLTLVRRRPVGKTWGVISGKWEMMLDYAKSPKHQNQRKANAEDH